MLVTLGRRVGWADGGECSGKGGVGERGTEGWADGGDADGGGEDELAEGAVADGGKGCSAGEIDRGTLSERELSKACVPMAVRAAGRTSSRMEEQPFGELLPYFCLFTLIFTDAGPTRQFAPRIHPKLSSTLPLSSRRDRLATQLLARLLPLAQSTRPPRPRSFVVAASAVTNLLPPAPYLFSRKAAGLIFSAAFAAFSAACVQPVLPGSSCQEIRGRPRCRCL